MPQGRIVLKKICQSKKLAELKTDGARLLYTWLLPNVDINGCFSGDEDVIGGQIFTRLKKTAKQINGFLQDLDNVGLIIWYDSNGDKFLQIPDFQEKQPSLNPNKEAESTMPVPTPEQVKSKSGISPLKVKGSKVKGSKVKGSKEKVKKRYGSEFQNIRLTDEEYAKLIKKFGQSGTTAQINNLDTAIESKGYKYNSHYATILSWDRKNERKTGTGQKRSTQEEAARIAASDPSIAKYDIGRSKT